ncbi:MAG: GNAT family N-acetyltransferase [Actinomycetota bacterium]
MSERASLRTLRREEIEPHIPLLESEGFTPEIDQGIWIGAFIGGVLAGWVRIFLEDGNWMLEDVYVLPERRRGGLASALLERAQADLPQLWLICDDDMIGFYEARGYELMTKEAFPEALAALYRAKAEWPAGIDHNHNALRWSRA